MKIEVAKHARMAERGSSLLKLLQNNDTPLLDLLIRESVQNSLDASSGKHESVVVDIGAKDFNSDNLIKHMDGIEDGLRKRFGGKNAKALYIADSHTVGLTGPFHAEEVEDNDYGNLQKLVYEISIPQQKEGAGGSWGLGKTVYFRFGIGLVFYYSRILKKNGEYEHRLAATMVEDEKKETAILPVRDNKPKRGIAWWGQTAAGDTTVPITDINEIENILDVFSIETFKGEETGTKIIIPFIDEERLLPKDESVWWNQSIEDYLSVSFQRWYSPRLDNRAYPYGSWLEAKVGGEKVTFENMERYFQIIQVMYNSALSRKSDHKSNQQKLMLDLNVEEVNLRGDFKIPNSGNAGKLAFGKFSLNNLKMTPPENQYDPYTYINSETILGDSNPPIIVYLRQPGMVVSYETEGSWCNEAPATNGDEFIIGLFVPNSESEFKSEYLLEYGTLEQYLRRSEKADHTSWKDLINEEKKITVISRIQSNVSKLIREKYLEDKGDLKKGKKSYLSRSLASKLLPPRNFGKKASPRNNPGGGSGGGGKMAAGRKTVFGITGQRVDENGLLELDFEFSAAKNQNALLELTIPSESGNIKGDGWESEKGIGTPFPLEINMLEISGVSEGTAEIPEFLYVQTKKYGTVCGAEMMSGNKGLSIQGKLKILRKDPMVQASFSVSSKEVNEV